MRPHMAAAMGCLIAFLVAPACGGRQEEPSGQTSEASPAPEGSRASPVTPVQLSPPDETVKALVGRLDLEKFKATIKGLTQFGDRRQGTDRNLAAVNSIEAQLRGFGCATERAKYVYTPAPPAAPQNRGAAPGRVIASGEIRAGQGGSRYRGVTRPTSVNTNPDAQPDPELRRLNEPPTAPGPREQVYCTKVGTTRPDEMYIVGAHMDGHGWGEAANDNGSGTALVMELARVFASPDVQTQRSIRFALWNNEETGYHGAIAYIEQRAALQGRENPPGSADIRSPSGSA